MCQVPAGFLGKFCTLIWCRCHPAPTSRFISLASVKTKMAGEVIQALMDRYISRFGCPLVIHSDNGKEFINKILKKLLAKPTLLPLPTTLSLTMWRGSTKPCGSTTGSRWTARHSKDWAKQLACLELAYNSKVNEAMG